MYIGFYIWLILFCLTISRITLTWGRETNLIPAGLCGENERRLYLPDLHTLSGSQTANDKSPHCKNKERKWKE